MSNTDNQASENQYHKHIHRGPIHWNVNTKTLKHACLFCSRRTRRYKKRHSRFEKQNINERNEKKYHEI
jgi:hypothetical protein